MAFIEHLLSAIIMCGAIRNRDYWTAAYSPKNISSVARSPEIIVYVISFITVAVIPFQRVKSK